jgi:dextranase
MLKRIAAAVIATLALVAPASAVTLTGPLIASVTPNKARYAPGDLAIIPAVLNNRTGVSQSGTLSCQRYGRGVATGAPSVATFGPLASGASATINISFPLQLGVDNRGYQVICTTADASGATLDTAATALDVASNPYTYARECMVTNYGQSYDTAAAIRGLNAYHCNVLQFYDVYWRVPQAFNPGLSWPNLESQPIYAQTVRAYIANANRAKAASFFFGNGWGQAYGPIGAYGDGITPAMARYRTKCAPNCTASDQETIGPFPSVWQAQSIVVLDPTNQDWWKAWISGTREVIDHFGYSGCQIDSLGDENGNAQDPNANNYRIDGSVIDFTHAFTAFINANMRAGCRHGTFNSVSLIGAQDAINSVEDFFYSEAHGEFADRPGYRNFHDTSGVLRSYGAKAENTAIYMDECASNPNTRTECNATPSAHCSTAVPSGSDTCYFNLPGLLYMHATVMASGAWNNNFINGAPATPDDPTYISAIDVALPEQQLSATAAAKQAVLDYVSFGVAHEKELRTSTDDGSHPVSVTSIGNGNCPGVSTTSSSDPTNAIYLVPRALNGLQTLSLINFCALNSSQQRIQDPFGTSPAAPPATNVAVKMYYGGAVTGANKLWLSSPDQNHGAPASVPFTKGSDASGSFITFTVPTLNYWSFAELELDALAASDYAVP